MNGGDGYDATNGRTVVIDAGSSAVRVGFAGDDGPNLTSFSAVVGHTRQSAKKKRGGICNFRRTRSHYIGDEAQKRADLLALSYPIEGGIVTNWADMTKLWRYSFEQIGIADPEGSTVLLSQPYLKRKANRKMLLQVLFEELRTGALNVSISGVLSLYASCRTTGLVLESGDGLTQVLPIENCQLIGEAVGGGGGGSGRFPLAGRHLSEYLVRMLYQRDYYFDVLHHRSTVNQIKERMCSVALDFARDIKDIASTTKFLEKTHKLPDGQTVKLGAERFLCPEALFEPLQVGLDEGGLQQLIYDTVMNCQGTALRKELFANIVLSGGCTLFGGFAERIREEVISLAPMHTLVNVLAVPERKNLNWIGGSVLGSLSTFPAMCITRKEYDEVGASIIYRRDL